MKPAQRDLCDTVRLKSNTDVDPAMRHQLSCDVQFRNMHGSRQTENVLTVLNEPCRSVCQ